MKYDALIGCVIVVLALGVNLALVLWSRRTISLIAKKKLGSARDISNELSKDD